MANEREGAVAVEELDGAEVNGRGIKVNVARPREERPERGERSGFGGGRPQQRQQRRY
jgi:RNA recognition motif-containing protein